MKYKDSFVKLYKLNVGVFILFLSIFLMVLKSIQGLVTEVRNIT